MNYRFQFARFGTHTLLGMLAHGTENNPGFFDVEILNDQDVMFCGGHCPQWEALAWHAETSGIWAKTTGVTLGGEESGAWLKHDCDVGWWSGRNVVRRRRQTPLRNLSTHYET